MFDYIYHQDSGVAHFVASLIPHMHGSGFGPCKAIGVARDGHLIGGLVYHTWGPRQGLIELSCAAVPRSGWMTRETVRRAYEYPFDTVGVQQVTHHVRADDVQALRILAGLGCMLITIPRFFGREHDGVMALLTREAWDAGKWSRKVKPAMKEAA